MKLPNLNDAILLPEAPTVAERYRLARAGVLAVAQGMAAWDLGLANIRLVLFGAGLGYGWSVWNGWPWWGLLGFVAAFGVAAGGQAVVIRKKEKAAGLASIFEEGLARVEE